MPIRHKRAKNLSKAAKELISKYRNYGIREAIKAA